MSRTKTLKMTDTSIRQAVTNNQLAESNQWKSSGMMVDSGAPVDLMDESTFRELYERKVP